MRHLTSIAGISLLAIGSLLSGCSSDSVDNPGEDTRKEFREAHRIELTDRTRAVASELLPFYDIFTLDMAAHADANTKKDEDGNVVVSPLSMAMLLSMVANGAAEESRPDVTGYLGVTDIEDLNALCRTLLDELPEADNLATLLVANSIWVNTSAGVRLTGSYSSLLEETYDAEVRYESFGDKGTRRRINDWCSEKTRGLIPDFLKESPEGRVLLLSALYFKDSWQEGLFKPERTNDAVFHGGRGDTNVRMMRSSEYKGLYSKTGGFEFLTIPFGNRAFRLEVILPSRGAGSPTAGDIQALRDGSASYKIRAGLPRFALNGRHNVSDMLAAIGMEAVSEPVLTMFEGMSQRSHLNYEQATSFSVDETGAEAAVVSGANDIMAAIDEDPSVEVTVDRPFWFFIREFSTGACILSGRIANL